ncbi:bidirectional hydrogenase complex protein HoxU [Synechococcus sp. RedBA-s]|uniref:bidirectional hydrogenase complex protein HoxU n=1 Tax=Synechococcus sp. RedBA-s TaxID=2823741 RepID=UPI0020CF1C20|nr:bidirectional hydrogenase complex protein HoxU [Synechococcus sp. RedBA-s]MCP9799631.1 bidirectional hydrogenase complex protein HoxU [Synechococcus sp. RedBA-s]
MSVRTLRIDGRDVASADDATVLEAARDAGVVIPTLCHLEGLSPVAACRLCLVEIEGSAKLQPACITPVSEGMVVHTATPRLQEIRRTVIELLFTEGNHVCAVCVANGHCELQDRAVEVGMDHARLPYRFPDRPVDLSHPRFGLDHNRCILCSRCVRVCDEVEGAHVWDVAWRGEHCRIIAGLDQPWGAVDACTDCGKCVMVCPTGALFHKGDSEGEKHEDPSRLAALLRARHARQEAP